MHVNVGGTWRQVQPLGLYVRVAGTWRQVQQGWVRVAGTWRQFFQALVLNTTITVGDDGVSNFGYNGGLYGSIGNATYTDRGANSRTISSVIWTGGASGSLQLDLNAPSVPDTDNTFASITINGVTYTRASRTSYDGAHAGGTQTQWFWSGVDETGLPLSGSTPFSVI